MSKYFYLKKLVDDKKRASELLKEISDEVNLLGPENNIKKEFKLRENIVLEDEGTKKNYQEQEDKIKNDGYIGMDLKNWGNNFLFFKKL